MHLYSGQLNYSRTYIPFYLYVYIYIQEENELGVEQNAEETEGAELFRQNVREASFKEHQTLLSPPRELEDLVSVFLFSNFSYSYKSPLGRPC